jgi:hypothetical protein
MATIPIAIPATSKSRDLRPKKPYAGFPLFPNQNSQWRRKVREKPYYFGKWADDVKGEQALQDWNVRQAGIMTGSDNLRVAPLNGTHRDGRASEIWAVFIEPHTDGIIRTRPVERTRTMRGDGIRWDNPCGRSGSTGCGKDRLAAGFLAC